MEGPTGGTVSGRLALVVEVGLLEGVNVGPDVVGGVAAVAKANGLTTTDAGKESAAGELLTGAFWRPTE